MARARYQVLVIPYCITDGQVRFCAFRRKDLDIWQFIAGGCACVLGTVLL